MHVTCKACGHGFCWLCMGGKETHGGADSHVAACQNFEQMKKLAAIVGDTEDKQLEYIRLNYFTFKYREHKNSIPFNRKQLR